MEEKNITTVTEFIILGFPEFSELQIPLFLLFLLIYLFVLIGNLTIITLTCLESRLHTPMYFFLCNLSFLDISYTSVTVPKLLDILLRRRWHIPIKECFSQLYFYLCLSCVEFVIITIMAYDRYVAICHPLHYTLIMNPRLCVLMASGTWIFGMIEPVIHTVLISNFYYCGSNKINHFFCDSSALLKLSCTSTSTIDLISYIWSVLLGLPLFISTLVSYIYVISNILRIRSAEGRRKAFSTCCSHLTIVILFYGTVIILYIRPTSLQSMDQNKLSALLYNVFIPMLNPVIYSLKNREVKRALGKVFTRK